MAHKKESAAQPELKLPVLIFGIVEIRRLKRELESLEDFMKQESIREPGKQTRMPRVSRLLEALATDNNLQLLQADHRMQIKGFLDYAESKAPNLHISFAVDPSSAFTAKIVTWLRANIHPHTLLEVGLQPTIAAGCIVRTTNKIFDFSLRERFKNAGGLLSSALQAVAGAQTPALASATTVPAVPPTPAAAPVVEHAPAQAQPVAAPAPMAVPASTEPAPIAVTAEAVPQAPAPAAAPQAVAAAPMAVPLNEHPDEGVKQ